MNENKSTILVVDDTEQNLSVLGNILMENDYEVVPVTSGAEALEVITELPPDLILLDIMMPEMDGYEVCKILKKDQNTKEIPIIFLTAKVETEDIVNGFRLGAVDYITKPFKKEELLARVRTHLELRRSLKAEQELVRMKDKLLSIIGHDLRGPIGSFMMMLEMVIDEENEIGIDKVKEYLQKMSSVAKNTYNLLDTLLTWARSQRNLIEYNPASLNLYSIVEKTIKVLEDMAKNKSISLSNMLIQDEIAFCDENSVSTVIRNLVSNSLKFTEEGGKILINSKKSDNYLQITIEDTGVGMAEANLKKLFRQDQIFSKIGTNGEKGSGLGLLLCKDFVEKNNGKIWVESEQGKGTSFHFTLPLSQ